MSKTDRKDAANEAVSTKPADDSTAEATGTGQEIATKEPQFRLGLSEMMQEKLSIDLARTLHQIEMGIGDTSASKVAKLGVSFFVVDGVYIDEFEDRKTGEVKSKVVFQLDCDDGVVRTIMQSAARPRKLLADACEQARMLGARFKAGPYKFTSKTVNAGPSDALIFEAQPGCRQVIY